jgi:hypothetical protein
MKLDEANIGAYAQTLVIQCRPSGVDLDFSNESLASLEALIDGSASTWNSADANPDHRNLAVFYAGCYLGETLARLFGGRWEFADAWQESLVRFASAQGDLVIAPFDIVVRRMRDGHTGNEFTQVARSIRLLRNQLPDATQFQ